MRQNNSLHRQNARRLRLAVQLFLVAVVGLPPLFALSGCGAASSGAFALAPASHYLLNTADRYRRQVAWPAAVPRELQKSVMPVYVVEPGDVLLVEPTSFDSPIRLVSDQTVLPDGTIDLGRFGRSMVAGLTVEAIEEQVEAQILATYQHNGDSPPAEEEIQVNVRLIAPNAANFYVLGEVISPGSFPYTGRETVLDAILAAGGLNDRASRCDIILSRPTPPEGCRAVLPVCYRAIVQLGDSTTNYQIMPGDRVYIATQSCLEKLGLAHMKQECPLCRNCRAQGGCELPGPSPVHYQPMGARVSPMLPDSPAVPATEILPARPPAEFQLPVRSPSPAVAPPQLSPSAAPAPAAAMRDLPGSR